MAWTRRCWRDEWRSRLVLGAGEERHDVADDGTCFGVEFGDNVGAECQDSREMRAKLR